MYHTGDPYNTYWVMNNQRSSECLEAWLSVDLDCSTGEQRISLSSWDKASIMKFRPFPYVPGDGVLPSALGYNQYTAEFAGECSDDDIKFLSLKDGFAVTSDLEFHLDNQILNFAFISDPAVPDAKHRYECPEDFVEETCTCACDNPPAAGP